MSFLIPRRVLITGATGFLGRAIIRRLEHSDWLVRGLYRFEDQKLRGSGQTEWVQIPPLEREINWKPYLHNVDCVVHAAAIAHQINKPSQLSAELYDQVNHRATATLAAAAKEAGVRRMVFISSIGAVTEMSEDTIDENSQLKPMTNYGYSKKCAEEAVSRILNDGICDWCILRPTLMYGPGNPGNMARLQFLVK